MVLLLHQWSVLLVKLVMLLGWHVGDANLIYKFTTSVRPSVTDVLAGGGKGGLVEATGDLSATGNRFHFHLH